MILTILASKLSENEISFLGRIFNNIDINKDGSLTYQELIDGFIFRIGFE
jgi:Ca2+-binding EF-hand superfamily protein